MSCVFAPPSTWPRRLTGFTLIEVLVAMVIVSVGLLGIAGLVVESQKNAFEVQQRATALQLAEDLMGRVNANPDGIASYAVDLSAKPDEPATLCDSANSNCSPVQMAEFDLWQWGQALYGTEIKTEDDLDVGGLVSPMACIDVVGSRLSVSIVWRGKFTRPDIKAAEACGDGENQYTSTADNDLRRIMTLNTRVG